MNKNAKKWVKALRSGKYKRTKDVLRKGNRFCCLGVACDLYLKEHPKYGWIDEEFLGEKEVLPPKVQRWLGLRSDSGIFCDYQRVGNLSLAWLNDDGYSFKKIADLIVKEPEGLFISEKEK